jgi:hypothetical protein
MISRIRQQQNNKLKHKRKKTDFERLIEKMERDGDYQTNHVTLRDRRERRERIKK